MSEVSIIGIDLAKRVFQLHGACANGAVIFRKKLTRVQLLAFMSQQPECTVALKSEAQQARAMLFRTRQMFIGQRTQTINALRGHLAEHGVVAPKGAIHVKRLADAVADETIGLPEDVRELAQVYLAQIESHNVQVTALDQRMKGAAKEAEVARRAQTMPGVGPIMH